MNDPTVTAGFQTVSFTGAFFDVTPVVFVLAKDLETEPRALRIQNVTTAGFEIIQVRPTVCGTCADAGNFSAPTISWIAIEPGRHRLPGYQFIEVGSTSTTTVQKKYGGPEGWDTIPFSAAFSSGTIAMVGQVQTTNNGGISLTGGQTTPFITTAIRLANASDFQTALELSEVVTAIPIPNAETIGWLAAPSGLTDTLTDTSAGSVLIEAILSADNITQTCSIDNTFSNLTYSSNPLVVASKNRLDGADGGWMRECAISTSAVRLRVQEDEGTDPDLNHTTESAGLFVVERAFDAEINVVIETPTMEVAEVTLNDTTVTPTFTSVSFNQTYTRTPYVFILPSNEGGAAPAGIRVRNVTTTGFEVSQVEPDSLDGPHAAMTVHYMAIQPGSGVSPWLFDLPDGQLLEVGTHTTQTVQHGSGVAGTEGWDTINFINSFTAPAVLTAIQGMANETATPPVTTSVPWLTVAMQNVGASSFQVALERAEVATGSISSDETIAYVAIEGDVQGSFTSGAATILYESITSADNIAGWTNNNCAGSVGQAVGFINSYGIPPLVMGNQSRHDGGDGGWLRRCSLTTAQIGLSIDEDQFANAERNHTPEAANLLAFSEAFCLPTACPGLTVDHYAINFPNGLTSLTCEAANVAITGHDFFNSSINIPAGVVLTLSTSTGTGTWQPVLISGTGTWAPSGLNDGNATYTWPGGESSFEVSLLQGAAGALSVNLVDALGKIESTVIASEDLNITFNTQGFRITDAAGVSAVNIDTHLSGKNTNVGFGAQTLFLQALRDIAGVCTNFGGPFNNINVTMASECLNPTVCEVVNGGPGTAVTVQNDSGTAIPIDINDIGLPITNFITTVQVDFDTQTKAPLIINYPDAGEIALHFFFAGAGGLPGTSNAFVVRPFGFDIDVGTQRFDDFADDMTLNDSTGTNVSWATDATGTAFAKAGNNFNVTVRSVVWDSNDDSDDDGVPDSGSDLTDNALTPNFGNEISTELVDIAHTKVSPTGAGTVSGTLTGGTNLDFTASGGTLTTTLSWDEVGIVDLSAALDTAVDSEYLAGGSGISATHDDFGRFVPDRFTVTDNTPSFLNSCGGLFSYMDQEFYFTAAPEFTVTALNEAGITIMNYGGGTSGINGFWQLDPTSLTRTYTNQATTAANFNETIVAGVTLSNHTDFGGMATLTLGNTLGDRDIFEYQRSTVDISANEGGAFTALVDLSITSTALSYMDGTFTICYDRDNDGTCDDYTHMTQSGAEVGSAALTGTDLRFGRLRIGTAAGSELLPISPVFEAQYYDDANQIFITNTLDGCTAIATTDLSLTSAIEVGETDGDIDISACAGGGLVTAAIANATFVSGAGDLSFSVGAPAATCTGYIDMTLDLSMGGLDMDWLQYDWDDVDAAENGPYDDNPAGRIDFGIFEGPSSYIYIREPW